MRAKAHVPSRMKRNRTDRFRATLEYLSAPREHLARVRPNKNVSKASEASLQAK